MHNIAKTFFPILLLLFAAVVTAQNEKNNVGNAQRIWLDSEIGHQGDYQWKMIKAGDATDPGEKISLSNYATTNWMPAIVPGTVLNSLVYNQKYPEPYYGINNKIESKLIPDISETGRDFYTSIIQGKNCLVTVGWYQLPGRSMGEWQPVKHNERYVYSGLH